MKQIIEACEKEIRCSERRTAKAHSMQNWVEIAIQEAYQNGIRFGLELLKIQQQQNGVGTIPQHTQPAIERKQCTNCGNPKCSMQAGVCGNWMPVQQQADA